MFMLFDRTQVLLIDKEKRYLDLGDQVKHCGGSHQFGKWIEHSSGDYISCFSSWNTFFKPTYHNTFHKLGIHHLFYENGSGEISPFSVGTNDDSTKPVELDITEQICLVM